MNPREVTVEQIKNVIGHSHNITHLCDLLGLKRQSRTYKILRELIKSGGVELPIKFRLEASTGTINLISDSELLDIINASDSYRDVLMSLGLRASGSNYRILRNRLSSIDFDCDKLDERRRIKISKNTTNVAETTYEVVKYKDFSTIRRYIINNNLLEYACQAIGCGNTGFYCGKPLTLELDHIDGNRSNNELINLRFLCPNCQTETFAGKSRIRKLDKYCECGNTLGRNNLSGKCSPCASKDRVQVKKFEISKDSLENLIREHSTVEVGMLLGVSDSAIRKRCIKLGIDIKSISKFSRKNG